MDNLLTQQEMEALLSAVRDGDVDVHQSRFSPSGRNVQAYDFRRPDRFSRDHIRTLQRLYAVAAQGISTTLSGYLRMSISLEATAIEEVRFEAYINSLPDPTYLNIISIDPLEGNGVLSMDLASSLAIVDRLLGGNGGNNSETRPLTEIEQVVADNAVSIVLRYLREGWNNFTPVDLQVIQREMEPRFVNAVPLSETVLLATFIMSGELGDGEIKFCIPLFSLDPVISKLSQEEVTPRTKRHASDEDRRQIRTVLFDTYVDLAAKIGSADVTIQELLDLKVGSVIKLKKKVTDGLRLEIDDKEMFVAKPGLVGRKLGAQITAVV